MVLYRIGGRPVFLPAQLLGWPLLVPGLFFLAGGDVRVQDVGRSVWTVGILASAPSEWLATTKSWVGLSMAAVGLVMLLVTAFSFDPRRRLVVMRYAPFSLAAGLFLLAGFLSLWIFSGHVVDVTRSGFNWRFVAELRGSLGNHLTTGVLFFLVLPTYIASFGSTRRLFAREPAFTRPQPRIQSVQLGGRGDSALAEAEAIQRFEGRHRVPKRAESKAKPTKTIAKGPRIQRASPGRAKAKAEEPVGPS
jgi:hypothetical protein